jgi:very-short-patch-repair endonuclease
MRRGQFAQPSAVPANCFKRSPPNSDTYSDLKPLGGAAHAMPFLAQNWPLVVFIVGAIGLIALAFLALRDGPPPYERRGVLLSPAEINFLRALTSAVREDWLVFSKVRLSDIIKVRSKTRKSQTWQNRIQGKHLDFVLCDYETLEVKLAIELDDGSQPRTERDRFVYVALTAAGLTLLRVRAQEKYETAALRKDIEDALGILRKKKRA